MEAHLRGLGMSSTSGSNAMTHASPYAYEIEHIKYLPAHVQTCKEMLYRPLSEVVVHWVDSEEALQSLANKLERVNEFAVDLEHHNYRTYLGFTCLMQVSTRSEDFLIDTLELRHHMHILAPAFADPRIVKVLHGADWDVQWLQRDFGIYVVNLFDTGQASR
jgi:exosome complex exonuclease RRP6